MPYKQKPDYLAIAIGTVGIVFQLGVWIWWGGRISERVEQLDKRVAIQENTVRIEEQTEALHTRDIAVLTVKLDDIKSTVDSVDKQLQMQMQPKAR